MAMFAAKLDSVATIIQQYGKQIAEITNRSMNNEKQIKLLNDKFLKLNEEEKKVLRGGEEVE